MRRGGTLRPAYLLTHQPLSGLGDSAREVSPLGSGAGSPRARVGRLAPVLRLPSAPVAYARVQEMFLRTPPEILPLA